MVKSLSDTVFCDGGKTSLQIVSDEKLFGWSVRPDSVNRKDNSRVYTGTELVRGYVKGANGCVSNPSNAIQVVKKDNPKVLTIVQKGTYTLAARADKPAEEYVWKLNGKVLAIKDTVIRASDEGKYSVIGKNTYEVKSSSIPLACLSIESFLDLVTYDDKGLSVYPNPSSGMFTLESRYDLEKVSITIYTMDGKLMYEDKIALLNTQRTLDLSSFSEGMYILRVETSTFKISKLVGINK
jgi:predicted secreted protein